MNTVDGGSGAARPGLNIMAILDPIEPATMTCKG
jgi:hypothetical protein